MEEETVINRLNDKQSSSVRPVSLSDNTSGGGLSKFVPILPKPLPPPPPRESTPNLSAPPPSPAISLALPSITISRERKRASTKVCPLSACRRVNCRLRTHQEYAKGLLRQSSTSSQSDQSTNSQAIIISSRSSTGSPSSAGVEGLPPLPVDEVNSAEYRSLFHDFFHRVREKITLLLIPPPISQSRKIFAAQTKALAFASAMTNPVYCLNAIAAAYFEQTLRTRGFTKDRSTVAMYGYLIQLLRQKLDDFSGGEVEDLLVVILTLVIFDAAAGKLDSLVVHRKGMVHLVDKAGGFHNLDRFLPYVIALDRTLALYSGQPPAYASRPDRYMLRPSRFPEVYGSFFSNTDSSMTLDESITTYASDVCRTIELLEGLKLDFDPQSSSIVDNPDCHYFYFLRDQVVGAFSDLNVVYFPRYDKEKCVLYTTRIVDYIVLSDNYIVTTPAFIAQKIREAIEEQGDIAQVWKGLEGVLHWVLFVLATLPSIWNGRDWATSALQNILSDVYLENGVWADGWKDVELENVRRFVWSDTRLNDSFQKICSRVEKIDEDDENYNDDCDGQTDDDSEDS